jgi:hypothetical protein
MAKTIKQIADELGLDKQRVYRFIKKNHISELHQKSGILYYDEAVESLIKSHFSKLNISSDVHQTTSNDAIIETLLKQAEILQKELEIKNKQIENLTKALDQEQQLHLLAKQQIQLLDQSPDNSKNKIFNFFRRGKNENN